MNDERDEVWTAAGDVSEVKSRTLDLEAFQLFADDFQARTDIVRMDVFLNKMVL